MFFLAIEILVVLFFIFFLIIFKEREKRRLLFYSVVFAFLFELFGVVFGGYIYNSNFLFSILKVPLFIALSWGLIITSSYFLIKKITSDSLAIAILTSIYVLSLDLFFEMVSVYFNFWNWGFVTNINYLNIDPSNFIGWILVTFCFVYFYERKQNWSVPLGFISYLAIGYVLKLISDFFKLSLINIYLPVIIIFIFFVVLGIVLYRKNVTKVKRNLSKENKDLKLNSNLNLKQKYEKYFLYLFRLPYILVGVFGFYIYKLYNYNLAIIFLSLAIVIEITFYFLLKKR